MISFKGMEYDGSDMEEDDNGVTGYSTRQARRVRTNSLSLREQDQGSKNRMRTKSWTEGSSSSRSRRLSDKKIAGASNLIRQDSMRHATRQRLARLSQFKQVNPHMLKLIRHDLKIQMFGQSAADAVDNSRMSMALDRVRSYFKIKMLYSVSRSFYRWKALADNKEADDIEIKYAQEIQALREQHAAKKESMRQAHDEELSALKVMQEEKISSMKIAHKEFVEAERLEFIRKFQAPVKRSKVR